MQTCRCITGIIILMGLASCQGLQQGQLGRHDDARTQANLERARTAWQVMERETPGTAAAVEAAQDYDWAVTQVVKMLQRHEGRPTWAQELPIGGPGAWRITFDPRAAQRSPQTWSLSEFARCEVASEVKLRHFDRVVAKEGLGVPVVLEQADPRRVTRPFHPPEGEFLPATAVLEFPATAAGQPAEAKLRFYNPLVVTQLPVGRHSQSLAENLTAPLQFTLAENYFDAKEGSLGALDGGEEDGHLFFLTPYDPTKVPVIFIHGVRSYAGVWKNMLNEMLADPELRRRYQPVCFIYPPELPVPASAACLRQLLERSREELDPEHDDAVLGRMVLVGHSMGGLLARMQVMDSGMDVWSAFFAVTPEEIAGKVDANTMRMVRESLIFPREPDVSRVVFICTPHQGSELADISVVRSLLRLVLFLPKQAHRQLQALGDLPPQDMHPELRQFHAFGLDGPDNSTTGHPFFTALARRPIRVPFHSIIAVGTGKDALTDGVVPYWSAHLEGAVSETKVRCKHTCLGDKHTVEAALRILKNNRPAGSSHSPH